MKRIIIISIYLVIFFGFIFFIYLQLKPKPNCFDNIQNQNEIGVDCGGVCATQCAFSPQKDLVVLETGFVESGLLGKIDLYAKISNPNQTFGSSNFFYEFRVRNSEGTVIASSNGSNFILPGETKHIIESNVDVQNQVVVIDLIIKSAEWVEANETYQQPGIKIVNKNYNQITGGVGFAEAVGLLKNESPLDFSKIKIQVILKDAAGKIVAINATEMNTVKSGENREFRVKWPNRFSGEVGNMEVQAEVNVFDSESFFTRFFKPEKFQQYEIK